MLTLENLSLAWHIFFHQPQSLFGLTLFRFLFGVLVAINGLILLRSVKRHLGPDAIFSFGIFQSYYGRRRLNLFQLLPEKDATVYLMIGLSVASGLLLAVGLFTRISSIVCFVSLVSLHHRNPAIFHSGDTAMRLMAFLLMFSPAGQGWSIDAYLNGSWTAVGDPWCLRLMQIQVSIIYLRTVYWKLKGVEWRDGTAVWYPVNCNRYRRFPLPSGVLRSPFVQIATWGTLAIEFSLGTLIWIEEFRLVVMVLGILLHLGLEFVLNLQLFGYLMIACILLFV